MKALSDRVHHATDHTHRAASSAHHASCSEEHLQVHIVEELDDRKPLMSVGELAKGVMYHESMKTGSARTLGPHPRTLTHKCRPLHFARSSTVRFIRMRTRAPHPARGERGVARRCPPLRPVQAHARIPTASCALAALRCAAGQTTGAARVPLCYVALSHVQLAAAGAHPFDGRGRVRRDPPQGAAIYRLRTIAALASAPTAGVRILRECLAHMCGAASRSVAGSVQTARGAARRSCTVAHHRGGGRDPSADQELQGHALPAGNALQPIHRWTRLD